MTLTLALLNIAMLLIACGQCPAGVAGFERGSYTHLNKGYPVKKLLQGHSIGQQRFYSITQVIILAIILSSLLSACSSGLQVRSDIDPSADFSQFTTYNYFEPMGIESGYNSPIFGEHYRAALDGEMRRRGYKLSETPDLLINVTLRADDKISIRSHATPYMSGGYYGRPGGASYGSAVGVGVAVGGGKKVKSQASVFIDFVEFEQHKVVWQGVMVIDVNDKVAQQLRNAIFTSVNLVMVEYPHTAGR
jgi:hypothetical protein